MKLAPSFAPRGGALADQARIVAFAPGAPIRATAAPAVVLPFPASNSPTGDHALPPCPYRKPGAWCYCPSALSHETE